MRFEQRILTYLAGWTAGDVSTAEDLAQDVFVKAHRAMGRYREGHSFAAWIYTIARRTAISHLRRLHRQDRPLEVESVDTRDPASIAGDRDERESLWNQARRLLKEPQFTALWLRYGEDLSIRDTAAAMQRSRTSVKVLLHRARARLACCIAQETRVYMGKENGHEELPVVQVDAGARV